MKAARLYGAKDVRIEEVPEPPAPQSGEVLIKVKAVGVCGSDLHTFEDGRIGSTTVESPTILGHEFAGEVLALGPDAYDGEHKPLQVGQRVAVDPTTPCWKCEMCEQGHPNLCPNHTFFGLYPLDGALQERMIVGARNCFPIPDSVSDGVGTLLETLGVALHTVDLSKLRIANSVAILGCGPVGLLVLRLAKLAGASPIYAFDCFPWRAQKALEWGATGAWTPDDGDFVEIVKEKTGGHGVDIAYEVAWANHSVQQAVEMARHGGRVMLVGIPSDDRLQMKHSVVRRKGLTLVMVRRMKHTYPRAIHLALSGKEVIDLEGLISHHFPLDEAGTAFEVNATYQEGVHKVIIDMP